MHGWLSSVASGPLMLMLSNATSTAWTIDSMDHQHQRKGKQRRSRRGPNRERDKGETNENQSDQPIRRRPKQGPALLYGSIGLHQESRFQSGPVSLADRGLARGAGRHRVAAGAKKQPRGEGISGSDISPEPAGGHVLHRR